MKKILVISNEFGFTQNVVRFAIQVARADGSLLHSIFLQPLRQETQMDYLFPNDYRLTGQDLTGESDEQQDQQLIASNLQYFTGECTAAGVPFALDTGRQTALKELIEHTWFSDLLIVDADDDVGPYQLADLLAEAHCPVCVVPSRAQEVEQVVLCYDGSENSLLALKLYSYLFPHWRDKPTVLLTVNSNGKAGGEEEFLLGWMKQHFPESKRELLAGDPQKTIVQYAARYGGNALVALGAYSRGAMSRLLHRSTADALRAQTASSLFIVHY